MKKVFKPSFGKVICCVLDALATLRFLRLAKAPAEVTDEQHVRKRDGGFFFANWHGFFRVHKAEKGLKAKDLGVYLFFSNQAIGVEGFFVGLELYRLINGVGVQCLATVKCVRFEDSEGCHLDVVIPKQDFDTPTEAAKMMGDISVFLETVRIQLEK